MILAPAMAPPAALPPPLSSGAPPGAPPPAQPFHSALAEEWARTAPAEGQQNESRKAEDPTRPHHEGEEHRHRDGEDPTRSAEASPGVEGLPSGSPEGRRDATAPSAGSSSHEAAAGERRDVAVSTVIVREANVTVHRSTRADHGVTPAESKGVAEQTAGPSEPKPAVDAHPTAETQTIGTPGQGRENRERVERPAQPQGDLHGTDRDGASPPTPRTASAAPRTDGTRPPAAATTSADTPPAVPAEVPQPDNESPARDEHDARTSAGVPGNRTGAKSGASTVRAASAPLTREASSQTAPRAVPAGSTKAHAAAQAATAATPRATSAPAGAQPLQSPVAEAGVAPQSAGGPLLDTGVDLQGMIDSINATIEIAARKGIGQARIALQPAELGQIRIHLSQTSDGLLARVTADTPAAAQALAASRGELQQSLSSLGTSLLGLDIGSFNQPDGRDAGAPGSARRAGATGDDASIEASEEPDGPRPAPRLPLGGLVDVLA